MKKIMSLLLLCFVTLSLTACGGAGAAQKPDAKPAGAPKAEAPSEAKPGGASGKRALVVYFSRADENYGVGFVEKGNTRILAEMIAARTNADTFEIRPVKPYAKDYQGAVDEAKREKEANARPAIADTPPNVQDYDVVFLGYPIWWGDLPMPFYTFFDKANLSGKAVAPFCTHEGSGLSGTDRYIAETTKAHVLEPLVMRGSTAQNDRAAADAEVAAWLQKLGLAK